VSKARGHLEIATPVTLGFALCGCNLYGGTVAPCHERVGPCGAA